MHSAQDQKLTRIVTDVFHRLFFISENTQLDGSGDEPIYLPSGSEKKTSKIIFTRNHWASALHEIAHWCIAGKERRKQIDYGYWYEPDGRSPEQQKLFEKIEIKPQALEWLFTSALKQNFFLSVDNLENNTKASTQFAKNVRKQALVYLETALPKRAELFLNHLIETFESRAYFDRYWNEVREHKALPN